jgi:hypothetical protein
MGPFNAVPWRMADPLGDRLAFDSAQTTGRGVFVPLAFSPGEAFQFDWSEANPGRGSLINALSAAHRFAFSLINAASTFRPLPRESPS